MIAMSEEKPATNVVPVRLTAGIAQKRIREIANVTADVGLGKHALEQMETREIFDSAVFRVLRGGYVDDAPEPTGTEGEWKCKITLKIRGGRTAGVVVILLPTGKLFVKTVEWEDL